MKNVILDAADGVCLELKLKYSSVDLHGRYAFLIGFKLIFN